MEGWLMAAYWIKVCLDTPRKPEMRLAAKMARLTKEQVFWHWFHLYAWADGQTADGFIPQLNLEDVAESSGVSLEFCRALSSPEIGWLFEAGTGNGTTGGVQNSGRRAADAPKSVAQKGG
jgi:hypothetical protein